MADMNALRAERTKRFRDALELKTPDRVPHLSYAITWKIFDGGYKLGQALTDYDIMEKVVREHQEKYGFDAMTDYGLRNAYRVGEAMGNAFYKIDDEKDSIFVNTDFTYMDHSELGEFAEDPKKFMYEKMMPRKFPNFNEDFTAEDMQKVVNERLGFNAYAGRINKIMTEEYGMPRYCAPMPGMYMAFENMFNCYRGIRGISTDMRKDRHLLHAALDSLSALFLEPNIEKLKNMPKGANYDTCFDGQLFFMAHTVLNRKQYEEFEWPIVKRIFDAIVEADKHVRIYVQGKMMDRFADFFSDYPAGHFAFHLEGDDIYEARKALPNCCLIGGMTVDLLGYGTREDCLNEAKKLVDELGGTGFILSQDKMLTYKHDAKAENLMAVCEYVHSL